MTWKKFALFPNSSVRECMEFIDKLGSQFAIVVDDDTLLGTVTDGDIRRALLKGVSFNDPVHLIMNEDPIVITEDVNDLVVINKFKSHSIRYIPKIKKETNQIIDLISITQYLFNQRKDNWVVLMAGGLGTRLQPLTNNVPKPLLHVGIKPILETIIESFIEHGFHKFFLSVNYKKELIKEYFKNGSKWGITIEYLDEDTRLGTAGALSLLPETPEKPFIVMNGDILTKVNFQQLLQFHSNNNSEATMCVREYEHQVPYGVIESKGHSLRGIMEKPTYSYYVNAGIYVLNPSLLNYIPLNTFFDMPTLFETAIKKNSNTNIYPINDYWMDIGRKTDFEKANLEYSEVFHV